MIALRVLAQDDATMSGLLSNLTHDAFAYWFAFRDPLNGLYCDTVPFAGPRCGDANNRYSSAGTGMGLVAEAVAAELGLLSRAAAEQRALQTLRTVLSRWPREPHTHFLVHYLRIAKTGSSSMLLTTPRVRKARALPGGAA